MAKSQISSYVIKRLPRYYRFLEEMKKNNVGRISSKEIAERMGVTASQIRQDLNCFGGFGQQGYGYNVDTLHDEIAKILGIDKMRKTILIGAGHLGNAVASHIEFEKKGCHLIGIFDSNSNLFGKSVGCHKVMDIKKLESFCTENKPEIAVLCIPKNSAKNISERLIRLGIYAFWNFSHYDIRNNIDNHKIIVENVHLADSLMTLSYSVNNFEK